MEGPRLVWTGNALTDHLDLDGYFFGFRSTGTLNKHHGKQKISFSRKFPFMKSRERLNKLDDEDSFENGSNHRWVSAWHFQFPLNI